MAMAHDKEEMRAKECKRYAGDARFLTAWN
jgi:hypothetical protein